MDIPLLLQGEVHLPLAPGMTGGEAIVLANQFYQSSLNPDDFRPSVVGIAGTRMILDLFDLEGTLRIKFSNKATPAPEKEQLQLALRNPVTEPSATHAWLMPPIHLVSADEMAFLDVLPDGETYPTDGDNTLAWKLSRLLNEYEAGSWVSGTLGDASTAGFTKVFKGWSMDVPEGFLVETYSKQVAILRINHGQQQGYLCLVS